MGSSTEECRGREAHTELAGIQGLRDGSELAFLCSEVQQGGGKGVQLRRRMGQGGLLFERRQHRDSRPLLQDAQAEVSTRVHPAGTRPGPSIGRGLSTVVETAPLSPLSNIILKRLERRRGGRAEGRGGGGGGSWEGGLGCGGQL